VGEEGDLAGVDVSLFDFLYIFGGHVFIDAAEFVGIDEHKVRIVPFFDDQSVGGFLDGIVVDADFHVLGLEFIESKVLLESLVDPCTDVFGLVEGGHHLFIAECGKKKWGEVGWFFVEVNIGWEVL
jgi:hypothetical protein